MKRKFVERFSGIQTPREEIGSHKELLSKVLEGSKGKEIIQSYRTADLTKPTSRLTTSSTRRISPGYKIAEETHAHGQPVLVEKIHISPREGEKTIKWLNKQFWEVQDLIIHSREEKRV